MQFYVDAIAINNFNFSEHSDQSVRRESLIFECLILIPHNINFVKVKLSVPE